MKRARSGLRSRLRAALWAWLAALCLALCSPGAWAGAYKFSDGTYTVVAPAGDCYTVGQAYLAQVQGAASSSSSVVLASCSVDGDGNVIGVSWDKWTIATGAHVGTYTQALSQVVAFADVPGAPFVTSDFTFVFSTIFVATLSLYLVAYGIGTVLRGLS